MNLGMLVPGAGSRRLVWRRARDELGVELGQERVADGLLFSTPCRRIKERCAANCDVLIAELPEGRVARASRPGLRRGKLLVSVIDAASASL